MSSSSKAKGSSTVRVGAGLPSVARRPRRRRGTDAQLGLEFRTWGGARAGAGRPPNGARPGVSHLARAPLSRHHPVHVTLRVVSGVRSLREGALFFAVRRALSAGKARLGFRLVHFSVQRDHLHLITEAAGRGALSRGIQGLAIRVARAVNRELGRRGRLFSDRYHAHVLKTPREARLALSYVLMNARKHLRGRARIPRGFVDPCSSAPWFDDWARPRALVFGAAAEAGAGTAAVAHRRLTRVARGAEAPTVAPVVLPRTWLLRVGVARAGPIDPDDDPSYRP